MPSKLEKSVYFVLIIVFIVIGSSLAIIVAQNEILTSGILGVFVIYFLFIGKPLLRNDGSLEQLLAQPKRLFFLFSLCISAFLLFLSYSVISKMISIFLL